MKSIITIIFLSCLSLNAFSYDYSDIPDYDNVNGVYSAYNPPGSQDSTDECDKKYKEVKTVLGSSDDNDGLLGSYTMLTRLLKESIQPFISYLDRSYGRPLARNSIATATNTFISINNAFARTNLMFTLSMNKIDNLNDCYKAKIKKLEEQLANKND